MLWLGVLSATARQLAGDATPVGRNLFQCRSEGREEIPEIEIPAIPEIPLGASFN